MPPSTSLTMDPENTATSAGTGPAVANPGHSWDLSMAAQTKSSSSASTATVTTTTVTGVTPQMLGSARRLYSQQLNGDTLSSLPTPTSTGTSGGREPPARLGDVDKAAAAYVLTDYPRSSLASTAEYAQMEVTGVLYELGTDPGRGLDSRIAVMRQELYGRNILEAPEDDGLAKKFFESIVTNPLVMLLLGSAALSLLIGNYDDAFSIALAILIVSAVGFIQEYRSEKSLEALNQLVPNHCNAVRGGHSTHMLADHLVPGDIVQFATGDKIPADVRIIEAYHLDIDESNLTGESEPVRKHAEPVLYDSAGPKYPPSRELPLAERTSIAFMGTLVRHGHGKGVVVTTGKRTEFGRIHDMMKDMEVPRTPLQKSMDRLGTQLSFVSFGVIGGIMLVGIVQGKGLLEMFTIGVSLAVAAIPEGLPIVVTVTLALGVFKMARRKAICKKLPSVETLGSVNVICADKTGTLTMNCMEVQYLYTVPDGLCSVVDEKSISERVRGCKNYVQLLRVGNLCNNAQQDADGRFIGQSTDIAMLKVAVHIRGVDDRGELKRVGEVPFSSDRKLMRVEYGDEAEASTLGDGLGGVVYVKGALEAVLAQCRFYHVSNSTGTGARHQPLLDEQTVAEINSHADQLANRGLRVVAAAYGWGDDSSSSSSSSSRGLVFAGLQAMRDPLRPGVRTTVERLTRAGVRVMMITGDSEATALSVARTAGIPLAAGSLSHISGPEIDALSEAQLGERIHHISVFARSTPKHKVKIVQALQVNGSVVAMTGDGVNDAPALRMADIGISMGAHATDVAKEAADLILVNDDMSTILAAIEEGKSIFYNIQNFLTFQLSTSVAALSLVALSTLLGLPNPLNAMQVLWINILMDGPPAQSLGVEPADPMVMKQPPRAKNEHILTRKVATRVLTSAAIILAGTMTVYMYEMQDGAVTARDTTMTFTTFVCFDMFNALSCRSSRRTVRELGLFSNRTFNIAVAGSLIGQLCVVYVPLLQSIFQTEALSFTDIALIIMLTSSVCWVSELSKCWARRRNSTTSFGRRGVGWGKVIGGSSSNGDERELGRREEDEDLVMMAV